MNREKQAKEEVKNTVRLKQKNKPRIYLRYSNTEKKNPLTSFRVESYLGLMPVRLQERISMFSAWNNPCMLKIQYFSFS